MGSNAVVVVVVDAVGEMHDDVEFGARLSDAIRCFPSGRRPDGAVGVSAAGRRSVAVDAAVVVSKCSSYAAQLVAVGGNGGSLLCAVDGADPGTEEGRVALLRAAAARLGYELRKE